jgi:hypothetical protein
MQVPDLTNNNNVLLGLVLSVLVLYLWILIVSIVKKEGYSDGQPFDYGMGQRRDVMRSDTGADPRSLSAKINDAVTQQENMRASRQENLVGTASVAPAFWEGSMYNLEGKMVGGAIESQRASETTPETTAPTQEGFDDQVLLGRETMVSDEDLLKQNFRGSKW